ncbi:hypothetical protein MPER_06278 [Moniliophthora perniciosa FA553]|nr:hypothetical protein MPER_06278 [Moniliophthora perniciosa FA553]
MPKGKSSGKNKKASKATDPPSVEEPEPEHEPDQDQNPVQDSRPTARSRQRHPACAHSLIDLQCHELQSNMQNCLPGSALVHNRINLHLQEDEEEGGNLLHLTLHFTLMKTMFSA